MAAVTAVRRVRGSARPSPPVRLVRLLARLALLGGCALAGYVVLTMLDGPAFADGRAGPDARPGLLGSLAGSESPLPRTLLGDHAPSLREVPPARDRSAARPERSSSGSDRTARDRTAPSEVERTRTAPSRVERARSTSDQQARDRRTPVRTVRARAGSGGLGRVPVVGDVVPGVGGRTPLVVTALPAAVDVLPEALPAGAGALPEAVGRVPTLVAVVGGVAEAVPEVVGAVPDGRSGSAHLLSAGRTEQPAHPITLAGPASSQPAQPGSVPLAAMAVPAVIPPPGPVGPPAAGSNRIFETRASGATSRHVARAADSAPPSGSNPPFGPNPPFGTGPGGQQATPVLVNGGQSVTTPATVGWQNPPRFPLTFSHGDVIRAGRWPGVPALPG